MAVNTTIHTEHTEPLEIACHGVWRPTATKTDDNRLGLEIWWVYEDGREVSDMELRKWCYCNLEGIPRYMGVATMQHLNAWAAAHPKTGAESEPDFLEPGSPSWKRLLAQYRELLYAVARKFPGETRHQTALRYIREREQNDNSKAWEQHKSDRLCESGR